MTALDTVEAAVALTYDLRNETNSDTAAFDAVLR
jgi:hypothetical protein